MTPENFCYWLQGWFELNDVQGLDKREASIETVDVIKEHLALVFAKVTTTPIRNCVPVSYGTKIPPEELGYQFIDTKFTGNSSTPLC